MVKYGRCRKAFRPRNARSSFEPFGGQYDCSTSPVGSYGFSTRDELREDLASEGNRDALQEPTSPAAFRHS